ncbi:hypothetical protein [Microbacterium aurantiacum]|uniref:hypothetical protein n=1 Tax=Microbacterium aurantiacum TaxID=162393 RepID=UPI0011AEE920|nr:hypothetical protein [Microbacterium aurantiacum]
MTIAQRDPLPRPTRWATALLGLVLGLMVASWGLDDLASAIVPLLLMLGLVAWMFAWRSDAGPAALGRYWRWPQISVFLATSALVAGTSLLAA